jgi:predicted HTH transcriptional regulator
VSFFDDRIEIENPGILLPGMTIEDVKQGVSRIRNRVIARVFRELDLIEQWGSGFRRILKDAEELGLPQPEIIEIGMRVRFTVYLAESIKIETGDSATGDIKSRPGLRPESRPELRPESELESQLASRVLDLLIESEAGKAELAAGLGHTTISGELKKQIKNLMELGYIEMTIPEKPTSSKQKYRLTPNGRKFLNKDNEVANHDQ